MKYFRCIFLLKIVHVAKSEPRILRHFINLLGFIIPIFQSNYVKHINLLMNATEAEKHLNENLLRIHVYLETNSVKVRRTFRKF